MSNATDPSVLCSVIIPAHNAETTLADQLGCLSEQVDAPAFEVIVVLNRCSDRTREVAESFRDRLGLRLVVADEKPSAAYARNEGAKAATGKHLLFCDADDRVDRHWVSEMHIALTTADYVGSRIEVDRSGLPDWLFERYYRGIESRPMPRLNRGHLYPVSAGLGVRSEWFQRISGFDEDFSGAGFEEVDFAARLGESGARLGIADDAVVRYSPRRRVRDLQRQRAAYARGNALYDNKHGRNEGVPSTRLHLKQMVRLLARRTFRHPRTPVVQAFEEVVSRHRRWVAYRTSIEALTATPFTNQTLITAPIQAPSIGGLAFSAHKNTSNWYGTDGIEILTLRILAGLLRRNDTFVDVGANIGTFAITAALALPGVNVVAFEPSASTRELLEINVARHCAGSVEIRHEAVSDSPARRDFYEFNNHEISGFGNNTQGIAGVDLVAVHPVNVTTLDDEFTGMTGVIKIDVEGFEPDVLAGARQLVWSSGVSFIVELNPGALEAAGFVGADISRYFPEDRWGLWIVRDPKSGAPGSARRVTRADIDALRPTPAVWYANLLAVPLPRAHEVERLLRSGEVNR